MVKYILFYLFRFSCAFFIVFGVIFILKNYFDIKMHGFTTALLIMTIQSAIKKIFKVFIPKMYPLKNKLEDESYESHEGEAYYLNLNHAIWGAIGVGFLITVLWYLVLGN